MTPPAYLPASCPQLNTPRAPNGANWISSTGLQLSVSEPDYIKAITAKVSWTLGVNQRPPRAGESRVWVGGDVEGALSHVRMQNRLVSYA